MIPRVFRIWSIRFGTIFGALNFNPFFKKRGLINDIFLQPRILLKNETKYNLVIVVQESALTSLWPLAVRVHFMEVVITVADLGVSGLFLEACICQNAVGPGLNP